MTELTNSEYQMILATVEEASRDAGATIAIRGAMWSPIFRAVEQIVAGRLAPIRALAEMWRDEAADRGAFDQIYTDGAASMLLHALDAAGADLRASQDHDGTEGQGEGERAADRRCPTCGIGFAHYTHNPKETR